MTDQALLDAATELGKQAGHSRAGWVFDGNTPQETYRSVLLGYNDGDPETMDMCPSPLSGEWADEPTPDDILESIGIGEEGDTAEDADAALGAYEDAFTNAWWNEVIRVARYHVEED